MPFAGFKDFSACETHYMNKKNKRTGKNFTKEEAGRVCGAIKHKVEDGKTEDFSQFSEPIIVQSDELQWKSEDGNFFVDFFLTTDDIDKVNDIVTPECQDDMLNQLRGREINIKMGVEHDVIAKGDKRLLPHAKIIDAKKIIEGKSCKIKATAKLNKHHPDFDKVKGSIEEGFLDATSIEYKPLDFSFKNIGGKTIRMLNKVMLGGVTFTGRAINEAAKIVDFYVKSQKAHEEYEDIMKEVDEFMKEQKSEVNVVTEEKVEQKAEEPKPEVKAEVPKAEAPKAEVKSEEMVTISKKEFDEMKAMSEEKKAREHDMKLAEEIKGYIKEAIKEIQPQVKALTEVKDNPLETKTKEVDMTTKGQIEKVFGKPI